MIPKSRYEFLSQAFHRHVYLPCLVPIDTNRDSQQLYMARQPLHIRYVRHDPIELPLDIVQIIFSQLDLTTLV